MADINDQTQNVSIYPEGSTSPITSTTDGAKERLDVDANITGGNFSLQPFTPKVVFDSAGVALTTAWSTLLDVTGEGKLSAIASSCNSSNHKVRLTVDGVVVSDLSMADLSAIGLSNGTNVEQWVETADKNYRYHPNLPVDFVTSLKIEYAMTTGTGTLKYIINYRVVA